jgi:acetyl-CoA carboxylase biotin carboxyl carrier protein
MDLNQLRAILDLVREHELAEFEIEQEGLRLKVRKNGAGTPLMTLPASPHLPMGAAPQAAGLGPPMVAPPGGGPAGAAGGSATAAGSAGAAAPPRAAPLEGAAAEAEVELAVVKSPIVGTFYRSPEPGAPPFVEIGATVKKGQVLCIIEAMKLMNEIDSEYDGELMNIYVENGQAVQYGERLFAIRVR